jgi:two-component system sensor histidine kinase SenX3
VAVGVRRRKDLVELSVTDQGIGIPEPDLERIFERFYRVDPARSRATGGTGLGLSIVKHVAGNHGGEVTVWSAEGSGSTFTIRLPIRAGLSATVNPIGPALSRGYLSGPANGTGHHYRTAREATP